MKLFRLFRKKKTEDIPYVTDCNLFLHILTKANNREHTGFHLPLDILSQYNWVITTTIKPHVYRVDGVHPQAARIIDYVEAF